MRAASDIDPAQTIAPYLDAPDDVIRCAAARALGALGGESAAAPLADALMDPDPDLRADAMAALARCARPEDAAAIRRSLTGDPVGEVKVAAVQALARLKDGGSVPLLRALALDRCETEVAWEEPGSGWDDWLDVQVAAIEALGAIGAEDAVDDLIEARDDEMGQDLDHVVFAALARMPGRGVPALRGFFQHGEARVRERALDALASAGREALTPLREALVRDPGPGVRRLAIDCFDEDDEALAALALKDPDVSVRIAALARAAPARPDVGRSVLRDPDESVRTAALEMRGREPVGDDEPDLVANVEAWLRTAGVSLATVCAAVLPTLAGTRSFDVLDEAANDCDRPPEVRIAALRSLGGIGTGESVDVLRRAAVDRSRQVRLAALTSLVEITRSAPADIGDGARAVLVEAVRGSLAPALPAEEAGTGNATPPAPAAAVQDEPGQGAPAPDDESSPALAPSSADDGASDTAATAPAYPRSTLEAIGGRPVAAARSEAAASPSDGREGSPEHRPRVRPGRVAVDGPDDFGQDLRLTVLRLAAACDGGALDDALVETAASTTPALRAAAFEAIARRAAAMPLSPNLTEIAVIALKDSDPPVRAAAVRALSTRGDAHRRVAPLLDDPDERVRAAALKAVAAADPEETVCGFQDPSPVVRGAALDAAAENGNEALVESAMRMVVEGGFADTLNQACRRYPTARQRLLAMLCKSDEISPKALLMILEAMSHAVDTQQVVVRGNGGE